MIISVRASELARLEICPGSHAMQKGLPDEQSELSKKGDILHHYDSHTELMRTFLTPQDQDLLQRAKELDEAVISRVNQQFELEGKPFREERGTYGRYSEEGYEITGHPDRIRFYEKITIVFEKKFGWIEQTPAEENKQARAYSVIFAKNESVVAMLQPRMSFDKRVSVAHYTKDDLEASWKEIRGILEEAADPYARLNPTEDGCRYCRAKLICKAYQERMTITLPLTPDKALSKAAKVAYLEQRLAELTDDKLEQVHEAYALATMIKDPLRDEERKRIEAGGYTNFKLGKETEVREVTDVRKAIALLSLAGLSKELIFECVNKISLTTLGEELRKLHPTWSAKQAREFIDSKLSSVIEKEVRKPRILRK